MTNLKYWISVVVLVCLSASGAWHVVPEDADYPTDDIIVAFCDVTDPLYGLPADTTNTDCTAAFQAALDDASDDGGGTVFVPAGEYRIEGALTLKANVTLRGRWREITADQPAIGTILSLYSTGSVATITLSQSGAGVRDLAFWHPGQDADNINTNYPFVINGKTGQATIQNITLINSYNGIDMSSSSMCCLRDIYGSPLKVGLTADKSYAVSRYNGIHFSPDFWAWSGLPGAPATDGAHRDFILQNGLGVNIKEMDGFHLLFSSIEGYWKGLLFQAGVTGDNPWGTIAYCTVSNCHYGIHFEDAKGIPVVHSSIHASEIAVWAQDHSPSLDTSSIASEGYAFYSAEGSGVTLVNCSWTGAVDIAGGTLKEHTYSEAVPEFNRVYDKVRKPSKTDLFNVKDYGAVGDGSTDDTAAVQAAVAAANANGGGIVFVPNGEYVMTGNLALAAGVELRGSSGGRHIASGKSNKELGSVLFIEVGEGDENGTPFITMGDYCGIRGLSFHYPGQVWLTGFKKYPFMIQGNGEKNYLIDCSASNPYQGAEFNGDNHLVEYTFFGGLRRTYRANNCSGGRIQSCHIKPDFWRDFWLDGPEGNPRSNLGLFKWNITKEGLEVFYLNGCTNYSISSIFNHASHTLFTADNSSGQTLCVGGEQLQQGYTFKNGGGTFDMIKASCNINSIGDYGGMHGIRAMESFNGLARFYSTGVQGSPTQGWAADGGVLYIQRGGISGPSNRGVMGFSCGANGTMILDGCSPSGNLGFRNEGSVAMNQCTFSSGMVYAEAGDHMDGNTINGTFILSDMNQTPVLDYGLVLDQGNVVMEDALIFPNENPASASDDARRVQGARTTDGDFALDVTEPAYADGRNKLVTIKLGMLMFSNSTATVWYDSTDGMKQGVVKSHNQSADWEGFSFSVSDAQFGGVEDIRIDVTGDALLEYVAVTSGRMPGDVVHTGNIILDNNDAGNSVSKTWTISDLNSSNLSVSGNSAAVSGQPSASGVLDPSDSFTLQATSVIGWNEVDAKTAMEGDSFGSYLAGLVPGKIDGISGGTMGPDSRAVYTNDSATTFGDGSQEALVYTVDTANLTSGQLYLMKIGFSLGTANDRMDFVIFDVSENKFMEQKWNSGLSVSGSWGLEHGDKIILGTGASNGGNEYRVGNVTLDVVPAGYVAWSILYGGSDVIGAETNDYDGDGLPNLGEYALGGNPTNALDRGGQPVLRAEGGMLLYIHPQRAADPSLVCAVESSTNLVSGGWVDAGVAAIGTNNAGSAMDYITNSVPQDQDHSYFRLKIVR